MGKRKKRKMGTEEEGAGKVHISLGLALFMAVYFRRQRNSSKKEQLVTKTSSKRTNNSNVITKYHIAIHWLIT